MTTDQGTAGGAELDLNTLVTPTNQSLNPNANIFQSKLPSYPPPAVAGPSECGPSENPSGQAAVTSAADGYQYINGDVNKLRASRTLFTPATPGPSAGSSGTTMSASEYATNGPPTLPVDEGLAAAAAYPVAVVPVPTPSPALQALDDDQSDGAMASGEEPREGTIPMDQLKAMLTQQLEYYFSRENLANDSYLLSQMDSDQYVPIWTVANFNQIKKLTKDLNLIVEVLRESSNVQVDEAGEKVRPNHKRCIVILREIAESTPLAEVEALFKGEHCPRFVSCEFAHNNSWYVTFDSDEDAQKAYRYLREEVKTFQGKSIMARIKAKPMARTSYIPKNGYRTVVDSAVYQQPAQPPQPQPPPQQPQHQPQPQPQQPQQQAQQRYITYAAHAHMTSMGYNSQQLPVYAFPPFYPPSVLQTWGPANSAYCDIGSVFSINGLAPQAAYKPNGPNRHNFTARARNQKGHNRSQLIVDRPDASRLGGHAICGSLPQKGPRPASADSNHSRWEGSDGAPPLGSPFHSNGGCGALTNVAANSSAAAAPPSPAAEKREDTTQTLPSALCKQSEGPPGSQLPPRRRKKDEDPAVLRSRPEQPKSSTVTKESKILPKFDLEAASFPPLPGTADPSSIEADVFENRMSDVVKGTAKPLTRDTKTQTSAPLSPVFSPAASETSVLTNGDAFASSFAPVSPPASPIPRCRNTSTADKATKTDEFLSCADEQGSPNGATAAPPPSSAEARQAQSSPLTRSQSAAPEAHVGTRASPTPAAPEPSNPGRKAPQPASCAPSAGAAKQLAAAAATTNNSYSDSMPKLSYAQMAQRAKEKVEKIAQEQKEKQEIQERERRIREREMTTIPKPNGGPRNPLPKDGRLPRDAFKGQQMQMQVQQQQQQQQQRDKFVGDRDRFPRKNRTIKAEMDFRDEQRDRRKEREQPMRPKSPK